MQLDGIRILVDPVLSGSASPVPLGTKAFKGADIYTVADLPSIDYLFISHDHYDHLDYKAVMQLKGKEEVTVSPGETFYESPADIHLVSRNASKTKPAKFIVVLLKKKDAPVLMPVE